MNNNANILKASYWMYLLILLFGLGIIAKILHIQIKEGDKLRQKGLNHSTKVSKIDALRGNIYTHNNKLLAVTTPKYEIRFDPISNKTNDFFNANVDNLAKSLSALLRDKSAANYKSGIVQARKNGNYYYLLAKNLNYEQYQKLKTFPILNLGRNKGGFIPIQSNKRDLPYNLLAKRTVGIYNYEKGKYKVGIEGAFDKYLRGTEGTRLMQKISGGIWIPIDPANEIEPKNGNDVITTIDIDIQDIAETALQRNLRKYKAMHGSVIVMKVETGAVLAIANLGIDANNNYQEDYNYAIGESSEPGSTFKIASILVALEDGLIKVNDTIDTGNGIVNYYNHTIQDDHKIKDGILSVQEVIEESSNVGMAKIINENYQYNPQKFIDGLYKIGLNKPNGLSLSGEGKPYIKNTSDKTWSGITLPWMAYGYELQITPLQTLAFYNAIANGGKMMKPQFVKEIRSMDKSLKTFDPVVLNERIASPETILKLQSMLEGVVLRGTAKNISNNSYSIAGKTGTAQIAQKNQGYNKSNYIASFVGYFPASNPKFSCIVVINDPSEKSYYGSAVAAPVFKEISDKIFANNADLVEDINTTKNAITPRPRTGYKADYNTIFTAMGVATTKNIGAEWVVCLSAQDTINFGRRIIRSKTIPYLIGMTAKDALFILEELGLEGAIDGKGFVVKQSVKAGTKIYKNMLVSLTLSVS
ncbi:MAG: penicillin-binding protein [Bacteroidales bacterium]|jgi:cell division protein FtsI (penicillin-binding protein 3)|nr:penicillin-binding protein [Bacteroidales bacterium]